MYEGSFSVKTVKMGWGGATYGGGGCHIMRIIVILRFQQLIRYFSNSIGDFNNAVEVFNDVIVVFLL